MNSQRFGIQIQRQFLLLCLMLFGLSVNSFAAPGDLDASFGTGGVVYTSFNNAFLLDGARAVSIQPDGKAVVVGSTSFNFSGPRAQAAIARYNADGTLDSSFAIGGKMFHSFGITSRYTSVVIQPDGKILAAGGVNFNGRNSDFLIRRYNANGSLDDSFGTAGVVTTGFGDESDDFTNSILLQTDGKIVAVGYSNSKIALARYNVDGSLDNSFDGDGKVVASFPGSSTVTAGVLQSDGKIIAAGNIRNETYDNFALARFNSDGSLDSSFGTNGQTVTKVGNGHNTINAVALQSDGKIIAVGNSGNNNGTQNDFALVRYNTNGSLDQSFGSSGITTTDVEGLNNQAFGIAVQLNGKILVSGAINNPNSQALIARYKADGTLDFNFGQSGIVKLPTGQYGSTAAYDVALRPDGKIIAVGFGSSFFVAQLLGDSPVYQTLPFAQDWSNPDLITVDNDWSGVPGIVGYLGNYTSANVTKADPRSVTVDMKDVQVTANQGFGDGNRPGSVTEFDRGVNDRTIALIASNTAKAPNIVIFINATGQSNIRFSCSVSDIDMSVRNSRQPVAVQYRIGATGDFSNVPGGYIAQATAGPYFSGSRTLAVTLPPIANNQPQLQIRVLTTDTSSPATNLFHNEWVGIDDISITANGTPNTTRPIFDFDGDRKSDVSVYRPENGVWYMLNSLTGYNAVQFGIASDKLVPADYDGDGKTDVAVFRDGTWHLQRSQAGFTAVQFGLASDIPAPADYDGDGKAEIVVFRPSTGVWHILNLVNYAFNAVQFGTAEDKPVAADYDGDGKADYAVYRPSNGVWYMLRSTQGFGAVQFGISTDKPVVGDYDGDGKADQAVYRLANGVWYMLRSSQGYGEVQFGISTDLPAPADYDGDGKTDVAIYRNGVLEQQTSSQGYKATQFGFTTDKPVPNAFVP
jgi:uncharacterized delta-60 repeat protein